jgi:hypothetical protein
MDKPTAAQQAYAAYAEVVGAAGTRLKAANTKVAESWAKNKPTTLIGWTVRHYTVDVVNAQRSPAFLCVRVALVVDADSATSVVEAVDSFLACILSNHSCNLQAN